MMAKDAGGLIGQIQNDALDESVALATALRKCLVLGGESGSRQLLEWATRELEGYGPQDNLPGYRVIHAPLFVDGIAGGYKVTHQQFPASSIPDFAREAVSERLELRYAIGALEAMLGNAEIMLQPPHASDLARYMNAQAGTQIVSLYWGVAHSEVRGVVDQVRTALTRLVVELRANVPDGDAIPSAEDANQAVNVIVSGESNSIQITTAQTAGADSPAQAVTSMGDSELVELLENLESVLREGVTARPRRRSRTSRRWRRHSTETRTSSASYGPRSRWRPQRTRRRRSSSHRAALARDFPPSLARGVGETAGPRLRRHGTS